MDYSDSILTAEIQATGMTDVGGMFLVVKI